MDSAGQSKSVTAATSTKKAKPNIRSKLP